MELISTYLGDEGYQVITVSNAEEGLALVKEVQPFVNTLDIMMPQKDSWSVLSELKTAGRPEAYRYFLSRFLISRRWAIS